MDDEKLSIEEARQIWNYILLPRRQQIIMGLAALPPQEAKKLMAGKIHEIVENYLAERRRRREAGELPLFEEEILPKN